MKYVQPFEGVAMPTDASGPLDDARRALQLVSDTTDAMRRLETWALLVDENVSAVLAKVAADDLDKARVWLVAALERLQKLDSLILGREEEAD